MAEVRTWLIFGLSGFIIGACFALIFVSAVLFNRIATRPMALAATESAAQLLKLKIPTRLPTPFESVTQPTSAAPTRIAETWLILAEQLLNHNEPQQVIDLLTSKMPQLTDPQDRAEAYYDLGSAEFQLQHYQLAAAHFAKLQELQPTGEHLYMLAIAYDLGGDLEHALASYTKLMDWNDVVSEEYRYVATRRVAEISKTLGTPTAK